MDFTIKHRNYTIEYIDSQFKLAECIKHLVTCDELGFDLEFDRDRYQYGFNLCLIQVASRNRCFVIDPLKEINLQTLFEVFENGKIQKVVSAADQDIRLLHSLNCFPKNVFDTDIAAKLLNYEFSSIGKLVPLKFNVELDKELQTSNWGLRPLTIPQIKYSVDDVIYLIKLKKELEKELKEKGIYNWMEDEIAYIDNVAYEPADTDDLLSKDDKKLSEYHQFVLNELLKYRDGVAKKLKKPTNSVMLKTLLVSIAMEEESPDNWEHLKGMIYSVKTEQFKQSFLNFYKGVVAKASESGLSKEPVKLAFTREERTAMTLQKAINDEMKLKVFGPIQERIIEKYGAFTARYIISNARVNELLSKTTTISDIKMNYKKELILSTAKELNVDVSGYV